MSPPTAQRSNGVDAPPPKRRKISINLQPSVDEMLNELAADRRLRPVEVIHDAIKLLAFVSQELASGRKVISVNEDGSEPKELVLQ